MHDMRDKPIVNISSARARARTRLRDLAAAANAAAAASPSYTEPPRNGRAWLNGSELGGADRRYAHLTRAHD